MMRIASPRSAARRADSGSVLPLVLVLTVVGSITVLALLNFAVTLFRAQPRLAERDDTFLTARSAMEMAIVFQRDAGPTGCYTDTQPSTVTMNGFSATVSCSLAGNYYGTARNQLGLITTSTDPAVAVTGPAAGVISGEVFISGADPADPRPWYDLVGDDPENDGTHSYPNLPPVPAYVRGTINPPMLGSCNLYFPGRYLDPLVLDGGNHYFASGVYYFEAVVSITGGARVVAGQGPVGGCAGGDAPAALAPGAPNVTAITGRGATFLFGGAGRLDVDGSRLEMNRRVSDATTRGSDGVSIRTINFGVAAPAPVDPAAPAPTVIPADTVFIGATFDAANSACDPTLSTERCLQNVADHQVQLVAGGTPARYTSSSLAALDTAAALGQTTGTATSNAIAIDGLILTPNASIVVNGGANADHRLELRGGVVANTIALNHQAPSTNYVVGLVDQALQRRFALTVQVVGSDGGRARSDVVLDVNTDGRYAINAWSVDAAK
jgi:hypothetical protein